MILFAVLVAIQLAPVLIAQDEIVVTAKRLERLKRLSMTTKYDRKIGASRCIFKRRSGDRSLDAIVCNAALACASKVRTLEEARVCVAPTMDALVADGVQWRTETDTNNPQR